MPECGGDGVCSGQVILIRVLVEVFPIDNADWMAVDQKIGKGLNREKRRGLPGSSSQRSSRSSPDSWLSEWDSSSEDIVERRVLGQ